MPSPLAAQEAAVRGLTLYAGAGGATALNSFVADVDDAKFGTDLALGGGAGIDVTRHFQVRGDFTWHDTEVNANSPVLAGEGFTKLFYGAEGIARLPLRGGITPYVGLGAGFVTLDPADEAAESTTEFAGRGSLGLEHGLPRSSFGLFAQGTGWLYQLEDGADERTQFDIGWTAGLSYRFGR